MNALRSKAQFLSVFLVVVMVGVTVPCQSVSAALITTENVLNAGRGHDAHGRLRQFFAREDVQEALVAHGIDPTEAKERIDALSDDEVIRIADRVEALPAGGSSLLLIGAAILVVTIVVYAIILLAVEATE